jgi:hypothetical protein
LFGVVLVRYAKKRDQKSYAEGGGFRRRERRGDLDRDHEEEEGGRHLLPQRLEGKNKERSSYVLYTKK